MKLMINMREGVLNLSSSKLRSILALLGILVGTASVVAMVLGGQLATNEALKQFKVLGTDLLALSISESSNEEQRKNEGHENISLYDALNMASADLAILDVAPYIQVYNPAQYEGHELNSTVLGVTENFARIAHVDLISGRFVNTLDKYAPYCVIGHNIYEAIKKYSFRDPIGSQLQVGKTILTIIGVADVWPENSFVYANVDNAIMVPLLTATTLSQYAAINNIILRIKLNADIEQVKNNITQYTNHMLGGKRLFFRSAKELIASMEKQSRILTVFLGLIGGISLLVGGIGVMNIMLVSVVERRREIGIRLAVGARSSDIRSLFLVEAVMLSLMGGTLGVLIGILIAYAISFFWQWEFELFLLPPLMGFSVSVAIGIFFGFYPAYQASKLDPIEALRAE